MSLLFPTGYKCIVCGCEIPKSKIELCEQCYSTLPFINSKVCQKCGRPITSDADYCLTCLNNSFSFDRCIACFKFLPPIDNLVYRLKYDGETFIAKTLSNLLAKCLIESGIQYDVVIPVPLFHTREFERDFNQSSLLISQFPKYGISINCSCVVRSKDTISQTHLTRVERQSNVNDAFKVINKSAIKDKVVVVVDDVFTTGSTINAMASQLLKAGAKKVYGLTVGHAIEGQG